MTRGSLRPIVTRRYRGVKAPLSPGGARAAYTGRTSNRTDEGLFRATVDCSKNTTRREAVRATRRRSGWALLLVLALLVTSAPAVGAAAPAGHAGPARVVVAWADDAGRVTAERAMRGRGVSVAKRLYGDRTALVDVPAGEDVDVFASRLERLPGVRYAEPDYPVSIVWTPNDPYFNAVAPALTQWGPRRIDAESAWNTALGTGVKIAIIDTGVDLDHPDLAAKLDTANDYDFVNGDTVAQDDNGHGSHCAGIAAAVTNNGTGVAGMAPDATILPVKTLDSAGNGSSAVLAAGIRYAVDRGADVVSMSLGGGSPSQAMQEAVAYAHAHGVVVVAATGNTNSAVFYPAAYPEVIAVGATDVLDARASYSNKGPEIDVVAPGGTSANGIISAVIDGYGVKHGTSMATPHVAGVAALMLSEDSTATPAEITQALTRTSRDLGVPGHDVLTGYGLINAAYALVALTSTDTAPPVTTSDAVPVYTNSALVTLGATDDGAGVAWTYSSLNGGAVSTAGTVAIGMPGSYTLDYWSVDRAGNVEAPTRVTFEVRDTIPPVTVSDARPTYQETADIRLYPTDGGTGVAGTYFKLDGGITTSGTRVIVPSAGRTVPESHTLEFWSRDGAGNIEERTSVTFDVGDYVAPVTTANVAASYQLSASITLSATDTGFGVARTRWALDGAEASIGTTITTAAPGNHVLAYASEDVAGNREATRTAMFRVYGRADVQRIAAGNRYGTAAALSRSAYPDGSVSTAVIASGEGFADALAASGLAGSLGSPVLLTARNRVPAELAAELDRLGAIKAIVVGGSAAVDPSVTAALAARGLDVERIAGSDRYATAAAVAGRVVALTGTAPAAVFVARGDDFADALAVAPLAYSARYPVLLVRRDALPAATASALGSLGVADVVLAGGTGALSVDVATEVQAAAAAPITRVAGTDRYDTAARIATFGLDRGLATGAYIGVATGGDFPDALAGGAVAGANTGVLLLTRPGTLSPGVRAFVTARGGAGAPVRVFGGTAAVSEGVRAALAAIPLL